MRTSQSSDSPSSIASSAVIASNETFDCSLEGSDLLKGRRMYAASDGILSINTTRAYEFQNKELNNSSRPLHIFAENLYLIVSCMTPTETHMPVEWFHGDDDDQDTTALFIATRRAGKFQFLRYIFLQRLEEQGHAKRQATHARDHQRNRNINTGTHTVHAKETNLDRSKLRGLNAFTSEQRTKLALEAQFSPRIPTPAYNSHTPDPSGTQSTTASTIRSK